MTFNQTFKTKRRNKVNYSRSRFISFSVLLIFISIIGTQILTVRSLPSSEAVASQITRTIPQGAAVDWETPQYNMLLILPPNDTLTANSENPSEWLSLAQEYAAWKDQLGLRVLIVNNYIEFNGEDEPAKLRTAIQYYYGLYPIEWVLILGDTQLIPIRYIYNPDSVDLGDHEALGSSTLKPTDFYYAELTSNWDIDGDGNYGEDHKYNSVSEESEGDFIAEVYLGRLPVDTAGELDGVLNKTEYYERAINAGDWMNRYLAASGISDSPYWKDADGEHEGYLNQYIIDQYIDDNMNWGHLIESLSVSSNWNESVLELLTRENVFVMDGTNNVYNALNLGCSIAVWAGHGSPYSIPSNPNSFSSSSVDSLTNYGMPSLFFSDACSTNAYDQDSLGEEFIKQPNTGGIGYIGSMRISWYYPNDTTLAQMNRGLTRLFFAEMFGNGYYQQGKALYESKKSYVQSGWFKYANNPDNKVHEYFETERKSLYSYMLLGDPSVDIFTQTPLEFNNPTNGLRIFEGTSIKLTITDEFNNPVPYARITVQSNDGYYYSFTSDVRGEVLIKLPQGTRNYTYSLSAHNMVYYQGSFSTESDGGMPEIIGNPEFDMEEITVDTTPTVSVALYDADSGVSDAYFVLTQNDFRTIKSYSLNRLSDIYGVDEKQGGMYSVQLNNLLFGDFSYAIVVFDNADNVNTTLQIGDQSSYVLSIPVPPTTSFIFVILGGISVFMIGIIVVIVRDLLSPQTHDTKNIKPYNYGTSDIFPRFEMWDEN